MTHHYLTQYGRLGFVGQFQSEFSLARGDRVVVRSPRGIELADILVAPERFSDTDDGDVLRAATAVDDAEASRLDARGQALLADASNRGSELGLPLAFVDVEVTLDGTAILHVLPWDACDATALLDELASRYYLTVRLLDLSRSPTSKDPPATGCGKPGCGSESGGGGCSTGGCSTGSCSRGVVKSSEELTAYFADLRQKMEDAGLARTPLN
jgi:hypothetical protein